METNREKMIKLKSYFITTQTQPGHLRVFVYNVDSLDVTLQYNYNTSYFNKSEVYLL